MAVETGHHRYPAGTGWLTGFVLGSLAAVSAWILSESVVIGLILLVSTGPALGAAFEQSLDTRPLTTSQRRTARLLALAGVLAGLLVLAVIVL